MSNEQPTNSPTAENVPDNVVSIHKLNPDAGLDHEPLHTRYDETAHLLEQPQKPTRLQTAGKWIGKTLLEIGKITPKYNRRHL